MEPSDTVQSTRTSFTHVFLDGCDRIDYASSMGSRQDQQNSGRSRRATQSTAFEFDDSCSLMRQNRDGNPLDQSYAFRTPAFFTLGKVFSTVFTEPQGVVQDNGSHNISTIIHGEKAYSHVARFIVVQRNRGFFYACPITTYGGSATLKPGCNPHEHAVAYIQGEHPSLLPQESLTKSPIEIKPFSSDFQLSPASRIRFSRGQPFQYNIKAKNLGNVVPESLSLALAYWRSEMAEGWEDTARGPVCQSMAKDAHAYKLESNLDRRRHLNYAAPRPRPYDVSKGLESASLNQESETPEIPSEIPGVFEGNQEQSIERVGSQKRPRRESREQFATPGYDLKFEETDNNIEYESVRKPKSFFKKGRVFCLLWPEPTNEDARTIHIKSRRLIIVRSKPAHCICVPIHTYSGQGTAKPGLQIQDHSLIIPIGGTVRYHSNEEVLRKPPLTIKLEDPSISFDPMSRVNFGKIMTVEHNVKIRNIGRIVNESLKHLEESFAETFGYVTKA